MSQVFLANHYTKVMCKKIRIYAKVCKNDYSYKPALLFEGLFGPFLVYLVSIVFKRKVNCKVQNNCHVTIATKIFSIQCDVIKFLNVIFYTSDLIF